MPVTISMSDYDRVFGLIMAGWASQTVRALATLSVAEHLSEEALTATQLAERTSCDPAAMYRLLRAATPLGLVRHDERRQTFCAMPCLTLLDSRSPVSLKNYAQAAIGPAFWLPALDLVDAVREGKSQATKNLGSDVFTWMDAHPAAARQFAAAMSELSAPIIREAVPHIDTSGASIAVDVGGAEGAFLAALLVENPHLSGIVLDLEHVIPSVAAESERYRLGERMRGTAGDFMQEIPEGDLFLLKFVLHDWDDGACRVILSNIRRAMRPGGRLWVVEMAADSGNASLTLATMDMAMMFSTGGQERELRQLSTLLSEAGFSITQMVTLSNPYHLIEAQSS
jgi:O-methyltransferase domain